MRRKKQYFMSFTNHNSDRHGFAQKLPISYSITTKLLSKVIKHQQNCSLLTSITPPQGAYLYPVQLLHIIQKCPAFAHLRAFPLALVLSGMYQLYQIIPVPLLLLPQLNVSFKAVFKWFLLWEIFHNSARRNLPVLFWWNFVTFCPYSS